MKQRSNGLKTCSRGLILNAQTAYLNLTKHSYQHTPHPLPAVEILATMPTDQDIENAYHQAYLNNPETIREQTGAPQLWGNAIDWHNMRHTQGFQNFY